MTKTKTKDGFICEAIQIHGDKYDYSKVEYIHNLKEVVIICKVHGEFLQLPKTHKRGNGCKKCGIVNTSNKQTGNIKEFIKKGIEIHGYKYDYSKTEYINCKEKVIIICKEHGDFLQTPSDHYKGGCKKCADKFRGENRRFTIEDIIQKSKKNHGETYDYSNIEYKNGIIENIKCKIHGLFSQLRHTHINLEGGCKKCADTFKGENRKFTTIQFIERAIKIHGDKYDYSKSEYTGINDKICITCKIHGDFYQISNGHINSGCGCQLCYDDRRGESIRKTTEEFIERAIEKHGDKYDYSKCNYISIDDKLTIICKKHGEFNQVAYSHINGQGCPTCGIIQRANIRKSNTKEFIEKSIKIHGDKYDYSKVEYISSSEKVIIICKKHGEFLQQPNNHTSSGYGCVLCVNKTEAKLYEQLKPLYPSLLTQYKQDWCKKKNNLPYDFCIPEYNIIIELDGRQHFQQVRNWSSPEEQFENDKYKEECANENGFSVIRLLQEDVFNDTYDWVKELCDAIEEIKTTEGITNIFLCKNNEYNQF
jgi:very-short-patch-repair endonuclease